ncbi:uncharacterized protein F5Z01DRAFT_455334 [Emericellopsis atlantica]|uniref:Uncharacterized protein n=1 Tax=Emericellopsis atlantica TaxID=2614577 RepID=A0A9P7ZSS3_9HYPO|nr:uncharacterized protein F5Z01DRAFT_455334 [Emericellopsis atlantica]KAG9257136.1 hypothetical protein F5Z01DRAFT_455334 [Emericellopsis atlantica]
MASPWASHSDYQRDVDRSTAGFQSVPEPPFTCNMTPGVWLPDISWTSHFEACNWSRTESFHTDGHEAPYFSQHNGYPEPVDSPLQLPSSSTTSSSPSSDAGTETMVDFPLAGVAMAMHVGSSPLLEEPTSSVDDSDPVPKREYIEPTGHRPRSTPSRISPLGEDARHRRDQVLLDGRRAGLTYAEIKKRHNLSEAESTLRGRHRTLTRNPEHRVRKPQWTRRDVSVSAPRACARVPGLTA